MNALVTGGAGFIGSHVVDALLRDGARVRVIDNLLPQAHPSGTARFLSKDAELLVADLRDREAVDRALEGIDTVFHLGGIVGNGQSMVELRLYADINVVGTATLLEGIVARRAEIAKVVVASSMVVYGDGAYACTTHGELARSPDRSAARLREGKWEPTCPSCGVEVGPIATREDRALAPTSGYGICKRDQEELALVVGRAHRIPTIALRYLNTYGSRQALSNPYTGVCAIMMMRMMLGKDPIVFEDGGQLRDPIHVHDVARATVRAASAPASADFRAFNIGAGRPTTVLEMARSLAHAIETDVEPRATGEFRQGDIRHCFGDVSLARDVLGFTAEIPFETGARELADWARGESPEDRTEMANRELRRLGLLG